MCLFIHQSVIEHSASSLSCLSVCVSASFLLCLSSNILLHVLLICFPFCLYLSLPCMALFYCCFSSVSLRLSVCVPLCLYAYTSFFLPPSICFSLFTYLLLFIFIYLSLPPFSSLMSLFPLSSFIMLFFHIAFSFIS